jgi:hypothetical protein
MMLLSEADAAGATDVAELTAGALTALSEPETTSAAPVTAMIILRLMPIMSVLAFCKEQPFRYGGLCRKTWARLRLFQGRTETGALNCKKI